VYDAIENDAAYFDHPIYSMLDATHDCDDAECFIQYAVYSLCYRPITDITSIVLQGITMVDISGRFYGWIKEESRSEIDAWLQQGVSV
jgi:hypothetical protein